MRAATLWIGLALASWALAGGAGPPAKPDFSVLAGNWGGIVSQRDVGAVYPALLTLNSAAPEGEVVGTSDYPSLGCGGSLVAVRRDGATAVVREVLSYGRGACLDNLLLYLTANPDGTLAYAFYGTDMTVPNGVATLTRRR